MKEATIERLIGQYAKSKGCLWLKFVSPGNNGVPDRILITPNGGVSFFEIKQQNGRVAALQQHWKKVLEKYGLAVYIVWSVDEGIQWITQELTK